MAEFQIVIKQFERLCNSVDRDCSRCKLNDVNCSIADIVNNSIEFEKRVMEWAEENPEPQYPSWWEYMCMMGVIPNYLDDKTLGEVTIERLMHTYIPADIAEKLGIEPCNNLAVKTSNRIDDEC